MTTPLPEPACLDTSNNMLNPFTESDFLCHLDLLGGLASTSLPSAHSVGNDSSPWLDSLMDSDGIAVPGYPSGKLLDEGAAETHSCAGLESSGFARPEPMDPMETGVSSCISEIVQTLCRLQQELVQLCGDTSKAAPYQPSVTSVDTILRPGQELVDAVRRLFERCAAKDQGTGGPRRRLIWDRQTLLPLVLTPLSLLLSMYGDMLREITTALPQTISSGSGAGSARGDQVNFAYARANHASTASYSSSGEMQGKYRDRGPALTLSPSSSSACFASDRGSTTSLISGNLNLSLGGMSLDRPLQLIITTTVVKHHLVQLDSALQQAHGTCHMQGGDGSPSERFFFSSIAELRSYTRLLIAETSKVV